MRNLLVNGYVEIDEKRVVDLLHSHLADLTAIAEQIERELKKRSVL